MFFFSSLLFEKKCLYVFYFMLCSLAWTDTVNARARARVNSFTIVRMLLIDWYISLALSFIFSIFLFLFFSWFSVSNGFTTIHTCNNNTLSNFEAKQEKKNMCMCLCVLTLLDCNIHLFHNLLIIFESFFSVFFLRVSLARHRCRYLRFVLSFFVCVSLSLTLLLFLFLLLLIL